MASGETKQLAVRGRFLPGLEGIRGLAISAVVLYHLHLGTFTGGFLGVDLFFVLSGFLITSLLIEEQLVEGKTDLLAFWIRRFKRLIPALFVLILALLVIIDLHSYFSGSATNSPLNPRFFRGDAISSIFFVMNWHAIHLVTSLQSGLFPRLLWPTWSLAVEEQFYLLWPLLTVMIFKIAGRKARRLGVAVSAALALAGASYLTLLYHWSHNADRVVYSTFTRGFSLAVGATLAWLIAGRAQPGLKLRRVLNLAGPLALLGMVPLFLNSGMLWRLYFPKTFMYHWGFALFALLACIVIADVRQSEPSPLARVLSFKPLRYLGTISYGLYLINAVVIELLPGKRLHLHGNWTKAAQVLVAIALASLSYRYLERPLRRSRLIDRHRILIPASFGIMAVLVIIATSPWLAGSGYAMPATSRPVPMASGLYPGEGGIVGQVSLRSSSPLLFTGALMIDQIATPAMGVLQANGITSELKLGSESLSASLRTFSMEKAGTTAVMTCETQDLSAQTLVKLNSKNLVGLHRQAEQTLTNKSRKSLLILACPIVSPRLAKSQQMAVSNFNQVAIMLARDMPGKVAYLPLADAILLAGAFAFALPPEQQRLSPIQLGNWEIMRMSDGVHLCQAGSVRLDAALFADLGALGLKVTPRDQWWKGSWKSSTGFSNPGTCGQ